jgi:uncharacterized BrkB/YihY/UPF0761 family membrane protein
VASIANFGAHNAAYGSLGAAVGVMTWTWICAIFSLLGAELEHQTARDSTTGSEKPLGRRGAVPTSWLMRQSYAQFRVAFLKPARV